MNCNNGDDLIPQNIGSLLQSIDNLSSFYVFPNPATDKVHLAWSELNGQASRFEMHNVLGQQIYIYKFSNWPGLQFDLDLAGNAIGEGWYVITLHTEWDILSRLIFITK